MTTAPACAHTTVLLNEAVDALLHAAPGGADDEQLAQAANGIYVDGTFGRGGHSRVLLQKLGARARLQSGPHISVMLGRAQKKPHCCGSFQHSTRHRRISSAP